MSRRSRTILTLSVRLPIPAGGNAEWLRRWVEESIHQYDMSLADSTPRPDLNEMQIRITRRETTYL